MLKQKTIVVLLGVALAQGSCATVPDSDHELRLNIQARPESAATGSLLNVNAHNSSGQALCIREEIIQKPESAAQAIRMRHDGRTVPLMPEGYLIPQSAGIYRLLPGESISFRVSLVGNFQVESIVEGDVVEVSVGVRNWNCADVNGQVRTNWSPWVEVSKDF